MEGWVDLVTRKRRRRESNSQPLGPESNTLATEPPSNVINDVIVMVVFCLGLAAVTSSLNSAKGRACTTAVARIINSVCSVAKY